MLDQDSGEPWWTWGISCQILSCDRSEATEPFQEEAWVSATPGVRPHGTGCLAGKALQAACYQTLISLREHYTPRIQMTGARPHILPRGVRPGERSCRGVLLSLRGGGAQPCHTPGWRPGAPSLGVLRVEDLLNVIISGLTVRRAFC